MIAIITNKHTKERKYVSLPKAHVGSNPNQIALEQVADRIIKRIAATYPKTYKVIHISKNHISIMSGNVTGCIFDIHMVEELKDWNDSFFD